MTKKDLPTDYLFVLSAHLSDRLVGSLTRKRTWYDREVSRYLKIWSIRYDATRLQGVGGTLISPDRAQRVYP